MIKQKHIAEVVSKRLRWGDSVSWVCMNKVEGICLGTVSFFFTNSIKSDLVRLLSLQMGIPRKEEGFTRIEGLTRPLSESQIGEHWRMYRHYGTDIPVDIRLFYRKPMEMDIYWVVELVDGRILQIKDETLLLSKINFRKKGIKFYYDHHLEILKLRLDRKGLVIAIEAAVEIPAHDLKA